MPEPAGAGVAMGGAVVIGRIAIRDAVAWADYRSRVAATLVPFGGTVVLRAAAGVQLGGQSDGEAADRRDVVVLHFDSAALARAWFDSAPYQAIVPLRQLGADVELTLYPAA